MKGFNDFQENLMRVFVLKGKTVICVEWSNNLAVKWNGKDWEECDFQKAYERSKTIEPKEAEKIAAFPPWDAIDKIEKSREQKYKDYMEGMVATTRRKVIGYINTAYGTDGFLPISAGDLTPEAYAAIIKDFRKNGYFFSGEDYQDSCYCCTPVLDNYYYVDFSRRGFGCLMARSKGDYSRMGYCHYTESMLLNEKSLKFPKGGLNKGVTRANSLITVSEKTFELAADVRKRRGKVLVAVPVGKREGYFWIGDGVRLVCGEKSLKGEVVAIVNFADEKRFNEYLGYRRIKCVYEDGALINKPLLLIEMRLA